MLAAQAARVKQSTVVSATIARLPAGLLELCYLAGNTMTVGVTTAAVSVFTLPFTSEPECAEEWDPLLSLIGRALGFVAAACTAAMGIAYLYGAFTQLRHTLQPPLVWALQCSSDTPTPGPFTCAGHTQVLAGVWGDAASEYLALADRAEQYVPLDQPFGAAPRRVQERVRTAVAQASGRSIALALMCVPWATPLAIAYIGTSSSPIILEDAKQDSGQCQRALRWAAWTSSVVLAVLTIALATQHPDEVGNEVVTWLVIVTAVVRGGCIEASHGSGADDDAVTKTLSSPASTVVGSP